MPRSEALLTISVMIFSVDGLTGFGDAISAVYPQAEIQRCIVHQIRYTTKFVASKDIKAFMEIFGPVVPVIGFSTDEEAIEIANSSKFGLSSCVFSRDAKRAMKVAKAMEAGGAVINGASFFRAFEQPFGGWKQSGIGNEGVSATFNEMTKIKTIVLKNIL